MKGLLDSQGCFTVSLDMARRKMAEFRSHDPERFLLNLVSAALAAGSRSLTIKRTDKSLELISLGSFIPEKEVLGGFEGLFSGQTTERAMDLILGLQSAFSCGVEKISLLCGAPGQDSYRWTISENEENQTTTEPLTEARMSIRVHLKRPTLKSRIRTLFSFGGGYAQMPRECRLVDSQAEFAITPITINSQGVNRQAHLPEAIVSAMIGQPPAIINSTRTLRYSGETWQGALALKEGHLRVVVSGLCYDLPKLDGLTGILYYQNLKLDLSRLEVIQDENYQWLMTAVREVKRKMFYEAVKAWTLHTPEEQRDLLDRLASLSARAGITESEVNEILESYESGKIVCSEHIELCYLWARENEFNQAKRHLRRICQSGYRLSVRLLHENGPHSDLLEKVVYFGENGEVTDCLLEWILEVFLSAYRGCHFDTERWHKKATEWLSTRFQEETKRKLQSALALLGAKYFERTNQERMSNHLVRVWQSERARFGESTTPLDADHYESILTHFSRSNETVRKVFKGEGFPRKRR